MEKGKMLEGFEHFVDSKALFDACLDGKLDLKVLSLISAFVSKAVRSIFIYLFFVFQLCLGEIHRGNNP